MADQKHTPGPWAADSLSTMITAARDGGSVSIADVHFERPTIAGPPISYEEATANALLISAAPELLAALQVMVLTPGILAHLEAADPMALAQARAAIAKALGQ